MWGTPVRDQNEVVNPQTWPLLAIDVKGLYKIFERGWAMDLIGKIYPPSSKGHSFIIVATDFFAKWVEALSMKKGTMFVGSKMKEFAEEYGIQLINFSPHFPQSNGQAEASNQVLIKIVAYGSGDSFFKSDNQNEIEPELYTEAMIMELEDLDEFRMQTYNALMLQKSKVARSYNKRVNKKIFEEGDVVWKVVLPLGSKDREFGKWSPNWEGPFKVH
ncbi:uncharacterized protein LOC142534177 [Primulina tabacum]|uniref:uncharacterized protein LOC142534177 n=1 Tax=Primulina tabacum TaxID=48773 RepID=UPI003F5ADAC1